MEKVSANLLSALLSANGLSGASNTSASQSGLFSDILTSQTQAPTLYGAESGDRGGLLSFSEGSLSSGGLQTETMLSMLAGSEGGLNETLGLFCMMLSNGVAGAGLAAALSSLSSALSKAPEGAAENLRAVLLGQGSPYSVREQANDALFSSSTSDKNFPYNAAKASTPLVTSDASNRSASRYESVIRQFQVESNPRYAVNKKGTGDTYCNIFMWDVTSAMGAEIPHYIDPQTKEARSYPNVQGAREQNANRIFDWLQEKGASYGWKRVSAEEAQRLANQGHPAVTIWKNPEGHGHAQVVCPSKNGAYDPQRGVTIAQAGKNLFSYGYITDVYKQSLNEVAYYAHI